MGKHHRQPEPIDILGAGADGNKGSTAAKTTGAQSSAKSAINNDKTVKTTKNHDNNADDETVSSNKTHAQKRPTTSGSVASGTPSDMVFPATPSSLAVERRARLVARRRAAGGLQDYGDSSLSEEVSSVPSEPASGEVDFDSSELGDDGNQEDDSMADLHEEDSDADGDYEAFLGGSGGGGGGAGSGSELDGSFSDEDKDEDDSDTELAFRGSSDEEEDDDGDDEEEDEEGFDFGDDEEGEGNHAMDDEDEDDDSDDADGKLVTVDFGVYDMKPTHVNAVIHLMDQLCPDKMDEVDRDDLGAALAENPYTYIVKVNDAESDSDSEEEGKEEASGAGADEEGSAAKDAQSEIYGLASVLDVAHGVHTHPAAFKSLHKLLLGETWRDVAPGIPPVDLLVSTTGGEDDDDEANESGRPAKRTKKDDVKSSGTASKGLAKCLLLVSEYIRTVPIELTVQILDDLVTRVEADAAERRKGGKPAAAAASADGGKLATAVEATPGCMFAVLAKVQRMVDPPVSLDSKSAKGKKHGASEEAGTGSGSGTAGKGEPLDLSRYAFWREEDNVLFDFRDKRAATLSYKCRPQHEGQAEQDIPVSLLFVLQYGAMRQAIAEMKKRATIATDITRY